MCEHMYLCAQVSTCVLHVNTYIYTHRYSNENRFVLSYFYMSFDVYVPSINAYLLSTNNMTFII